MSKRVVYKHSGTLGALPGIYGVPGEKLTVFKSEKATRGTAYFIKRVKRASLISSYTGQLLCRPQPALGMAYFKQMNREDLARAFELAYGKELVMEYFAMSCDVDASMFITLIEKE